MVLRFKLTNLAVRIAALIVSIGILLILSRVITGELIIGVFTDSRVNLDQKSLSSLVNSYPNSAGLLGKLAAAEQLDGTPDDLRNAEQHLQQAVKLSPNNYIYRMQLAEVQGLQGNLKGEEQSLNDAVSLAPKYSEAHWQMANLLVQQGKINQSIEHFRLCFASNPDLIPATLDLIWQISKQNLALEKSLVEGNESGALQLASFLAERSRVPESAEVFDGVDKKIALASPESAVYLDNLVKKGYPKLATDLWEKMSVSDNGPTNTQNISNGSFENELSPAQPKSFNWQIVQNNYVRASIDNNNAHSGKNSLLLSFLGKDTTRLNDEIRKLIVLRPDPKYRLECFVKTRNFRTPEGPKVVISDAAGKALGSSEPIEPGTYEWTPVSFNFTAPSKGANDGAIVYLSIKRQPHFSYDDPTSGQIWFDDFAVTEIKK